MLHEKNLQPLVSVVTPSYNQADYIEETILCVMEQTYPRIEHLIIDGGSTDGTIDILQKYNENLVWISESDRGQTHALNKGFRRANGQILGWLNADDLYTPNAVELAVDKFHTDSDIEMVHGAGQYIDQHGNVIMTRFGEDVTLEKLLYVNTIMSTSIFMQDTLFERIGELNEELHYVMDWEYWTRAALANCRMAYIPEVMTMAREHTDSKTMQVKESFWQERFDILDDIYNSTQIPAELADKKNHAYAGVHASAAFFYLRNGHIKSCFKNLYTAWRLWPGIFTVYSPALMFKNMFQILNANMFLSSRKAS